MSTPEIICAIVTVVSFCSMMTIMLTTDYNKKTRTIVGILGCIFAVSLILGTMFNLDNENKKPKMFDANKYTLEYKITEFQGQKDTTYILIQK